MKFIPVLVAGAVLGVVATSGAGGVAATGTPADDLAHQVLAADSSSPDTYFVNEEVTVAQLKPDGLSNETHLISRLAERGGPERTIVDPNSTTNVEYLNQTGRPDVVTDGIKVTVGGPEPTTALTRALFDKVMPAALHVEYTLNDEIVPGDQVVGASGELEIKYLVTNVDFKEQELTYQNSAGKQIATKEPVFAPFVGTLSTTLPGNYQPTETNTANMATDDRRQTILTWSLLTYPPIGTNSQAVSFKANIQNASLPGLLLTMMPVPPDDAPATKFSDDLIKQSVEGNVQLTDGVEQLNQQTLALANGAAQLSSGMNALADGANAASAEVDDKLVTGAEELAAGTELVAEGNSGLVDAIKLAELGADGINSGATDLEEGMDQLVEGINLLADLALPGLRDAAALITEETKLISAGGGSSDDPPLPAQTPTSIPAPSAIPTPSGTPSFPPPTSPQPTPTTLVQGIKTAVDAAEVIEAQLVILNNNLVDILGQLGPIGTDIGDAATSAKDAATTLAGVIAAICPANPECANIGSAQADAANAAAEAGNAGTGLTAARNELAVEAVRAYMTAWASDGLVRLLRGLEDGINLLAVGLNNDNLPPGLVQQLELLTAAIGKVADETKTLQEGAAAAQAGAKELASGAGQLADGLQQTEDGSQQLSEASDLVAEGAQLNVAGTQELAKGISQLAEGTDESATGAAEMATGADALASQGTQALVDQIVEGSEEPALAEAYFAAAAKMGKNNVPYGLPEGATGSSAYVLVLREQSASNTAPWLLGGVGLLILGAGGGMIVRQLRS